MANEVKKKKNAYIKLRFVVVLSLAKLEAKYLSELSGEGIGLSGAKCTLWTLDEIVGCVSGSLQLGLY